jgi:hypothetical protein
MRASIPYEAHAYLVKDPHLLLQLLSLGIDAPHTSYSGVRQRTRARSSWQTDSVVNID